MELTKNSKNEEIVAAFGPQVESGKAFIYGIFDTVNDDFVQLGIAQQIETPGSASVEQQLFLGWGNNKTVVRCLQNVAKSAFEAVATHFKTKLEVGAVLDGANIQINESTTPNSWVDGATGEKRFQEPKVYPQSSKFAGRRMVTQTGENVYRNTSLVLGAATHGFIENCVPAEAEVNMDALAGV